MKSLVILSCVYVLSVFLVPSCGGDDLCQQATERMDECVVGGAVYDFCELMNDCPDCIGELTEHAECVVEAEDCVEVANGCTYMTSEVIACVAGSGC
jgi:hypothetical protein